MQQIKTFLLALTAGSVALFMFFVGLGLTLFMMVVLAIMSLFMKSKNHAQLKSRWQHSAHYRGKKPSEQADGSQKKSTVIEGQYTVVD